MLEDNAMWSSDSPYVPPGAMSWEDFQLLAPGDIVVAVDPALAYKYTPNAPFVVLEKSAMGFLTVRPFDPPHGDWSSYFAWRFAVVGRVQPAAGTLYEAVLTALGQ